MIKKSLGTNEKRLGDWIRRNAYEDREEGIFCKIVVRHVVNKNKLGEEIMVVTIPKKRTEDWELDTAKEIISQLNVEATQFGGMQHYAAYSFYDGEPDKHVNRCIVSIQGTATDDDDGLLSEAPDGKGLVAQAMRHQEANARILMGSVAQTVESMRRQNERLITMNEKLIESRFELLGEVQELLDEKNKRDIESRRELAKVKAFEEGVETVKQLAPVIANKMAGAPIFAVPNAGLKQLGNTFFKSMTEEQIKVFMDNMTDAQKIQFYSIMESLTDESKGDKAPSPGNGAK